MLSSSLDELNHISYGYDLPLTSNTHETALNSVSQLTLSSNYTIQSDIENIATTSDAYWMLDGASPIDHDSPFSIQGLTDWTIFHLNNNPYPISELTKSKSTLFDPNIVESEYLLHAIDQKTSYISSRASFGSRQTNAEDCECLYLLRSDDSNHWMNEDHLVSPTFHQSSSIQDEHSSSLKICADHQEAHLIASVSAAQPCASEKSFIDLITASQKTAQSVTNDKEEKELKTQSPYQSDISASNGNKSSIGQGQRSPIFLPSVTPDLANFPETLAPELNAAPIDYSFLSAQSTSLGQVEDIDILNVGRSPGIETLEYGQKDNHLPNSLDNTGTFVEHDAALVTNTKGHGLINGSSQKTATTASVHSHHSDSMAIPKTNSSHYSGFSAKYFPNLSSTTLIKPILSPKHTKSSNFTLENRHVALEPKPAGCASYHSPTSVSLAPYYQSPNPSTATTTNITTIANTNISPLHFAPTTANHSSGTFPPYHHSPASATDSLRTYPNPLNSKISFPSSPSATSHLSNTTPSNWATTALHGQDPRNLTNSFMKPADVNHNLLEPNYCTSPPVPYNRTSPSSGNSIGTVSWNTDLDRSFQECNVSLWSPIEQVDPYQVRPRCRENVFKSILSSFEGEHVLSRPAFVNQPSGIMGAIGTKDQYSTKNVIAVFMVQDESDRQRLSDRTELLASPNLINVHENRLLSPSPFASSCTNSNLACHFLEENFSFCTDMTWVDHKNLLVSHGTSKDTAMELLTFDLTNPSKRSRIKFPTIHTNEIREMALCQENSYVLSVGYDSTVAITDILTAKIRIQRQFMPPESRKLQFHNQVIGSARWHSTQYTQAGITWDQGYWNLLDMRQFQVVRTIQFPEMVYSSEFIDSNLVVVGDACGYLYFHDLRGTKQFIKIEKDPYNDLICDIRFQPETNALAVWGQPNFTLFQLKSDLTLEPIIKGPQSTNVLNEDGHALGAFLTPNQVCSVENVGTLRIYNISDCNKVSSPYHSATALHSKSSISPFIYS